MVGLVLRKFYGNTCFEAAVTDDHTCFILLFVGSDNC